MVIHTVGDPPDGAVWMGATQPAIHRKGENDVSLRGLACAIVARPVTGSRHLPGCIAGHRHARLVVVAGSHVTAGVAMPRRALRAISCSWCGYHIPAQHVQISVGNHTIRALNVTCKLYFNSWPLLVFRPAQFAGKVAALHRLLLPTRVSRQFVQQSSASACTVKFAPRV